MAKITLTLNDELAEQLEDICDDIDGASKQEALKYLIKNYVPVEVEHLIQRGMAISKSPRNIFLFKTFSEKVNRIQKRSLLDRMEGKKFYRYKGFMIKKGHEHLVDHLIEFEEKRHPFKMGTVEREIAYVTGKLPSTKTIREILQRNPDRCSNFEGRRTIL